jgi:hypothetical protein
MAAKDVMCVCMDENFNHLVEILISMIWMKLLFHWGKQVKNQSNAKDDICSWRMKI